MPFDKCTFLPNCHVRDQPNQGDFDAKRPGSRTFVNWGCGSLRTVTLLSWNVLRFFANNPTLVDFLFGKFSLAVVH